MNIQELIIYLLEHNIDHFFIAPGHRSAPIAQACIHNPYVNNFWGFDERSLGFTALGYSKKAKKPGVIIVTSGTAVANLLPSIVEARMSDVPMIIISADRPYELRDTGANQTIDQVNIFGKYVIKYLDIPPLNKKNNSQKIFGQIKNLICQANFFSGPVHINLQLREPLYQENIKYSKINFKLKNHNSKIIKQNNNLDYLAKKIANKKILLVVGEESFGFDKNLVLKCAQNLGWAIYADILSNIKTSHKNIISFFDLLLLNKNFAKNLNPEIILYLGGRLVSKRFWELINNNNSCEFIRLDHNFKNYDQTGKFENFKISNFISLFKFFEQNIAKPKNYDFLQNLINLNNKTNKLVNNFLDKKNNNEAYYACELIKLIKEPVNFFVSSSMPIRELDLFASSNLNIRFFANRGASGIDGIISTACGLSLGDKNNKPVILLIGDIAFLHDLNSLNYLSRLKNKILIILINNQSGGIFNYLPVSQDKKLLTPYLDTPHNFKFGYAAQAFGIRHTYVKSPREYEIGVKNFFHNQESQILEVIINKEQNIKLHKEIYLEIAELN